MAVVFFELATMLMLSGPRIALPRAAVIASEIVKPDDAVQPATASAATVPVRRDDRLRTALTAAAEVGDATTARSVLDDIIAFNAADNRWPNPRCFDDAIIACSRASPPQWESALEVLQQMTAVGLEPRSYAFNGAITACARAGEPRRAVTLINQMAAMGVAPDLVSFNAALSGTRITGDATLAMQLLTRMRDRGLAPNGASYYCAVSACRRASQAGQALTLVDAAAADGLAHDEALLTEALAACGRDKNGREGDAKRLWGMLSEVREGHDGSPPRALDVRAYNARLLERGTAGDWRGALALLDGMAAEGTPPDDSSCSLAARACGRTGAWEEAVALLRRSEDDLGVKPSERMYGSAMQACGKAGEWSTALQVLNDAEDALTKPSAKLYGAAMHALAMADGQSARCLQLLDRMRSAGVEADLGVYGGALHACQREGEWQEVYDLLYIMRGEEVTTPETMLPFHKSLWKRAKKELA